MVKRWLWIAALLAASGISAGELKIVRAKYGTDRAKVDVTERFSKEAAGMEGAFLMMPVSGGLAAADPAPGEAKKLELTFHDSRSENVLIFPEKALAYAVAGVPRTQEFSFGRAFYGVGRNWTEVTGRVLAMRKNRVAGQGDYRKLFGVSDPAHGKNKELVIFYSRDRQLKMKVYRDGVRFAPAELETDARQ